MHVYAYMHVHMYICVVSVQGVSVQGVSAWGVLVLGVSVWGVLVRGGGSFCPFTDTVLLFEGVCTYLDINVRMLKVETLNLKTVLNVGFKRIKLK